MISQHYSNFITKRSWLALLFWLSITWIMIFAVINYTEIFTDHNNDELEGISYLMGISFLAPSAILFFINQENERKLRRDSSHKYVIERHLHFIGLCIENANLSLESGRVKLKTELNEENLLKRDILFDALTSLFESAFLTYADPHTSSRHEQWRGWNDYILRYCNRDDYLEWWYRVIFENSQKENMSDFISEYDRRFDEFILPIIKNKLYEKDLSRINT